MHMLVFVSIFNIPNIVCWLGYVFPLVFHVFPLRSTLCYIYSIASVSDMCAIVTISLICLMLHVFAWLVYMMFSDTSKHIVFVCLYF